MKVKRFEDINSGVEFILVHSDVKVFRKVKGRGYNALDLYTSYSEKFMEHHHIGKNALVVV